MSDFMEWKEKYSVGNEKIDSQHKKLFNIVTRLHKAKENKETENVITVLLDELVEYVKTHFETEEEIMENCSYPELQEHKTEHLDFTLKMLDFTEDYKDKDKLSSEILDFLKTWIKEHIIGTDKKYVPYIK